MSVLNVSKTSIDGQPFADRGQRQGTATATTTESIIPGGVWKLQKGVTIKAAAANSADLIVGNAGNAANGFHIGPGQSAYFAVDDIELLGVVSASGSQTYSWLGV